MKYQKVDVGHIVFIDPRLAKFDVIKQKGGILKAGQHAQRLAKSGQSFAINGTFFYRGRILGDLLQLNGSFYETLEIKNKKRYGFAITNYDAPTIYSRQVILGTGKELEKRFKEMYSIAIGGLGCLISEGKNVASRGVLMDANGQYFQGDAIRRTSRPAIGIDKSGIVMIFIATKAMTPNEMAKFMLTYKITDAIFLDGGRSSCFAFKGAAFEKGINDPVIPSWLICYE